MPPESRIYGPARRPRMVQSCSNQRSCQHEDHWNRRAGETWQHVQRRRPVDGASLAHHLANIFSGYFWKTLFFKLPETERIVQGAVLSAMAPIWALLVLAVMTETFMLMMGSMSERRLESALRFLLQCPGNVCGRESECCGRPVGERRCVVNRLGKPLRRILRCSVTPPTRLLWSIATAASSPKTTRPRPRSCPAPIR